MNINNNILVPNQFKEYYKNVYENHRIFYISAPCGSGKTSVLETTLKHTNHLYISLPDDNFINSIKSSKCHCIVIDNLHYLNN